MDRYRLLRNTVVNIPKQSKRSYFKGLGRCGTKQFWKVVKYLRNKSQIPDLQMGSMNALTGTGKATMLNEFIVVSQNFNASIPPLSPTDCQNFHISHFCPDSLLFFYNSLCLRQCSEANTSM